jgi:hypothetical protein
MDIRRGRCPGCGKTFTFLPLLSFPYTHYSSLAVGHCGGALWSTVPRKKRLLGSEIRTACPIPPRSFSPSNAHRVSHWLAHRDPADREAGPLCHKLGQLGVLTPSRE